jgi:hypothetical protein
MALNKEQLILDTTALSESDNVGAYIRSSDGTLITHTNVGGKDALDVNIVNDINVAIAPGSEIKITDGTDDLAINADGSINSVVTATDLDIRDLAFATDKVDVSGSSVELGATTLAALENITVSATDLDIRDLAFATDKVDVTGSEVELGATTLAALENITVSATDLDIRNLSAAQDNVAIANGANVLAVNADGSINVNADVSIVNGSDKLEDAAHASGDVGTYVLSVREDTLAISTSASGDYQSFKTDALGRQYSNSAAQTAAFSAKTVNTTAGGTDLVTTDLANRTKILIQNIGSKPIYIGNSGVTAATGIKVPAGASAEFEAGPQVNLFAITDSGSSDVRIMELA